MKFQINNTDISIKFHHENNTNSLNKNETKSTKPSFTICTIQVDNRKYTGKAQLHKGDNFSKSFGRLKSLKRALTLDKDENGKIISYLTKDERNKLYQQYFTQCKIK
jgi:hypothetical protein